MHPEYQDKVVGQKIIKTLEQNEYFLRTKRVEIPASITGTPFYLKMGYTYKNDVTEPNEEPLIRLKKYGLIHITKGIIKAPFAILPHPATKSLNSIPYSAYTL